jgi:hypothetical protein
MKTNEMFGDNRSLVKYMMTLDSKNYKNMIKCGEKKVLFFLLSDRNSFFASTRPWKYPSDLVGGGGAVVVSMRFPHW